MPSPKEIKQAMNPDAKPWEESQELGAIADKIYQSGKFQVISTQRMKFYITNGVKEIKNKKYKVSVVKGILTVYLPEVAYTVEVDNEHWQQLSPVDKYLLMSHVMLSCALDENGKPNIMKPDIQEFKELVVNEYLDLAKISAIIK